MPNQSSSTERRRAAIIVNPASGRARARRRARKLLYRLVREGVSAILHETTGPGDGRKFAAGIAAEVDVVVSVGGDGTLNEVLNGLLDAGSRTPAAVITTGTANVVAGELGLPPTLPEMVEVIRHGPIRSLDMGLMRAGSGAVRRFAMCAGAGFDAAVVEAVHRARTGTGITHWSYARPILSTLLRYKHPPLRIAIDGKPLERDAVFAVVANMRRYGGNHQVCSQADPDDGLFDICCLHKRGMLPLLRLAWGIVRKNVRPSAEISLLRGKVVELSAAARVPVQADGDAVGILPMRFEILPAAAHFCVAAASPQ